MPPSTICTSKIAKFVIRNATNVLLRVQVSKCDILPNSSTILVLITPLETLEIFVFDLNGPYALHALRDLPLHPPPLPHRKQVSIPIGRPYRLKNILDGTMVGGR